MSEGAHAHEPRDDEPRPPEPSRASSGGGWDHGPPGGAADPDPTVRIERTGQDGLAAGPRAAALEEGEGGRRWLVPTFAGTGALLVGLLAGWLLWSGGGDDDRADEVGQLTAQNAELRTQVDDLTAQIAELEAGEGDGAAVEELAAENEQLAADLEDQKAEVARLTGENEDLTDQVSSLEEANAQLQGRIEQILDDLDAALVAAPDLVGSTANSAASQADEHGWVLVQIPTASDEVAAGTVLSQAPPAGTPMLSGSALAIGVAAVPEPPPAAGAETVFEDSGRGPATSGTFVLEGGIRHVLAYSFTGEGRHVVSVVDADGDRAVRLVDVNGTKEGGTGLPLTGTHALEVDVEDDVEWELRVVALP